VSDCGVAHRVNSAESRLAREAAERLHKQIIARLCCVLSQCPSPYPKAVFMFFFQVKTRRRAARFHCPISLIVTAASLSLNPDLLRATGVCLHVDLFASVCIDDLERGGRMIQPHRLDLGIDREGVSDC